MFAFIRNWFKPKSFEEIKAERKALREKIESLEKKELAYETYKELGKINIKDKDAAERIVYLVEKLRQLEVNEAIHAASYYLETKVFSKDDKLATKVLDLWKQTKTFKQDKITIRINKIKEDFV